MYEDEFGNSSNFNGFTGYIMRGDVICANIAEDKVIGIEPFAPLQIKHRGNFIEWLEDRSADLSRSYIRNILKHLNLSVTDRVTAVKHVHAASLTDTFWIKDATATLTYKDTKFCNDLYFKAALVGDPDLFSRERVRTPEVTSIGSYNKGWRFENNTWRMYKAGSALEVWSEIFASKLAVKLRLDAVEYTCVDGFAVCENFVKDGACFEAAKSLIGSDTAYAKNIEILSRFGLANKYLDIVFMDAIVRNDGRHEFNYGFLTNNETIDLVPNFDNNISLFRNGIPTNLERKDVPVSELKAVLDTVDYDLPFLSPEILSIVYSDTMKECNEKLILPEIRIDTLVQFCMNAYNQLLA